MKKISKFLAAFLMVFLIGTGFAMEAKAASGELVFADPETAVGEQVEVKVKLRSGYYFGDIEMKLTYDPEYLRLIKDDADENVTGENGEISITGKADENATEVEYLLKFYALQEGSTNINVSGLTVKDKDGDQMEITEGSSAVAIAAGDASKIPEEETETDGKEEKKEEKKEGKSGLPEVNIDGTVYHIAKFDDIEVLDGFERTTLSYEGQECDCLRQENSGVHAFYLEDSEGNKSVFLYDGDTGAFTPMHLIDIGTDNYIILLRDTQGAISIGDPYKETTITIGGDTFPTWQNPNDADYYLVYALNKDGKKTIYRYDAADKTYQRFAVDTESGEDYQADAPATAADDFVDKNWKFFAATAAALILLLMILLLVVRIKLARRDRELDDLYDEYGIDLEDEEEELQSTKKESKKSRKEKETERKYSILNEEDFDEEDLEDSDEEEFEEYVEESEEDQEDLEEEDFEEEDFEEVGSAKTTVIPSMDDDSEEELIDDLDELLSIDPEKKRGHMEDDDTFKVDFIELDD